MKKTLLVSSLFVATALMSQSALAEVKFRVGGGSSTYELGGDYITAKSTYSPASAGLTFSWGTTSGGYIDLSGSTGKGKHDGWTKYGTPSEDFKRLDWALTGGVVFLNQNNGIAGNVYIGVKGGTTTLGANKAVIGLHYANPWSEETFDTAGVIFGGGASFPIAGGRAGSVGVNVGLGVMGATWKDDSAAGYKVTADTAVGGSLGVGYTFPFSSNFGVTADYKYHSYSYNFGNSANPFKINERISTLTASLYAKF